MDEIKVCAICGETLEDDREVIETSDGKMVHYDCIIDDEDYEYCEYCYEWHPTTEMVTVIGRNRRDIRVCEDCVADSSLFFYCDNCEDYFLKDEVNRWIAHDGADICVYCYEEEYGTCDDCGEVYSNEDLNWDDDADGYICGDCAQRRDRDRAKIHNYGYKPSPKFKSMTLHDRFIVSSDITEPTLGVELEIDKGHDRFDCAEELVDASEDIYCKEDGSLSCGIEIVSHPATLDYHLQGLGWDKLMEIAMKYDYKSHDAKTCGLHVHVGREQLGKDNKQRRETITKIMLFVVRHWSNIVKFSRREERQISGWAKMPYFTFETGNTDMIVDNAMNTVCNGRYQAVNLTNSATIEFRVFNGTLKKETLFATLQWVDNLCRWAKEVSFEAVFNSKWSDVQNYKEYAELNEYCVARAIDENIVTNFPKPIKIGDRVKINDYDTLAGLEGTIMSFNGSHYGVQFNLSDDAMRILRNMEFLHNLNGALNDRTGRWFSRNEIVIIEEEM